MTHSVSPIEELEESYDVLCENSISAEAINTRATGLLYVNSRYLGKIEGATTAIAVEEPKILVCSQTQQYVRTAKRCSYNVVGSIPVERNDTIFTLVDIESGQTLAMKEFEGPIRGCPSSVPSGSLVVPAEGYVDDEIVLTWLHNNWSP